MMTRREFIKVAGAGVLAVSCAGMLSGCDVVESLQDMDFVSVTIGEVKFMVGSSSYALDGEHHVNFGTDLLIRNKTKSKVTIPKSDITGTYYCKIDEKDETYPMKYDHDDIVAQVTPSNELPTEIGDFGLTTVAEIPENAVSQKVEFRITYGGYEAVFAYSMTNDDWILPPKTEKIE